MSERKYSDVKILQLTDSHLHATTDSRMRGVRTHDTFLAVLDRAGRTNEWPPDVILVTGDIVQDESRAGYERFRNILDAYDVPVLCIPGNHDDPKLMAELLNRAPFQMGGERRIDQWSLVLLSTFLIGEDAGGLGRARLDGLDRSLRENASQHVLVCLHHHPLPVGSTWLDGVGLRDARNFLDVLDAHANVRAVLCGHVHQESDQTRNGVRFMSTPSTCSQFLPHSQFFALDDKGPGLRWLCLQADGRIETRVCWVRADEAE